MQDGTRRQLRRVSVVAIAAAAMALLGCAPAPGGGPTPSPNSHLSRWTHGEWSLPKRDTKIEVNLGFDDPAGADVVRAGEVNLSQSWCDRSGPTKVLVERRLASTNSAPFSINEPRQNMGAFLNVGELSGTETRTPAGNGSDCGEPTGAPTVSEVSVTAITAVNVRRAPGSLPLEYERPEQTADFYYRDAVADGHLTLIEPDGFYELRAGQSSGSWFWEGFWQDATGAEIVPGA